MSLHVFRHVEAHEFETEQARELARDLGLANAGRACQQVGADRLFGRAQPRTGQLDRGRHLVDRLVLAEHHGLEIAVDVAQQFGVVLRHALGWDARDLGDDLLDVWHVDGRLALVLGPQHLGGADLVDHVDRLVWQLAVVNVAGRQLDRGLDGVVGVGHVMVLLVDRLQPLHDLDGVADRRLRHVDFLEAADQRTVLLEVIAVLLVGG